VPVLLCSIEERAASLSNFYVKYVF